MAYSIWSLFSHIALLMIEIRFMNTLVVRLENSDSWSEYLSETLSSSSVSGAPYFTTAVLVCLFYHYTKYPPSLKVAKHTGQTLTIRPINLQQQRHTSVAS